MQRLLVIAAALGLVVTAPAGAQAPRVDRGVVFAVAGEEEGRRQALRLDLFSPRRAERPRPAIVWIHGGGFARGHRRDMAPFAARFARLGYVAATIDYRLFPAYDLSAPETAPEVRAARDDALAAVRWLRRHAPRLGIDPARIHVAGSSAGGMTALNVALHPAARVRAAVSVMGYAPVTEVPAGAPPLLLLHGTEDRTIPFALAESTCVMASAAGVPCELAPFAGYAHRLTWRRSDDIVARVAGWLRAHR